MQFLDLFAGIGGGRSGLELVGHKCIGYVEKDKYARQSYQAIYNTEGEWTKSDITEVKDEEWRELRGKVDLIIGGFPCQAFSIAGNRRGFEDARGTMFFEIARAAKQIKPCFLLLENVKGILSHDQGRTFGVILNTLDELGYDTEWRVLNSKNHGLAQNRERVYIVGHLRGRGGREIFSFRRENEEDTVERLTINQLGSLNNYRSDGVYGDNGISPTLRVKGEKIIVKVVDNNIKQIGFYKSNRANSSAYRTYDVNGISPTITTSMGGGLHPHIKNKNRVRRLTPLEYWRLQGFTDQQFQKAKNAGVSDSQLYKQAGNAMSVNVVHWIGERLKEE